MPNLSRVARWEMKFTQTETDLIRHALMAYCDRYNHEHPDQNILERLVTQFSPQQSTCAHCGAKFARAFGGAVLYCRHCKTAQVIK